ncbi:MAG: hypothetical protein LBD02_01890 [Christensenellaceae bacterium]|jgi:hypothetical protein|nr:hypothetical protein [Christensenellaceae bacterium]
MKTCRFARGIGALADAAYGMDSELALREIAPSRSGFGFTLTSVDLNLIKQNKVCFMKLLEALRL